MPHSSCSRLSLLPAVLLSTSVLAACSDPIGPSDVAGMYVLERIGSDALPAVYQSDEYFRLKILADTLWLNEDGSGRRTALLAYEALQGGDDSNGEVPVADEFTFQVVRGRIEIAFACDDTSVCAAPPHFLARLKDGRLQVFNTIVGRVPLIYTDASNAD